MQIYKNNFDEKSEALSNEQDNKREQEQAKELFRHKTYIERFKGLNFAASALGVACSLLSFISSCVVVFLVVYSHFDNKMIGITLGVAFASVLAALIEKGKRDSTKLFFVSVFQYRKVAAPLLVAFLLCWVVSVSNSIKGASLLPSIEQGTAAAAMVDIDTLSKKHDAIIQAAKTENKRGETLRTQGAKIVLLLEQEKAQAIKEARLQNKEAQAQNKEATAQNSYTFAIVAAANEALILLCLLFGVSYRWNVNLEALSEAKEQGAAQEQGLEQIEPKNANKRNDNENSANEGAGRPIGFFGNDNTPVTAKQRMCDNCGEAYDYKHVKQKFCSNSCRVQSWNKKNRKELPSF